MYVFSSLEINADGSASVRLDKIVTDSDGQTYVVDNQRKAYVPGDDVTDAPPEAQAIIGACWTPAVVAAWDTKMAAQAEQTALAPADAVIAKP